jgi:oligopeptide/dipeptide ABC transporter ATP-binding protein
MYAGRIVEEAQTATLFSRPSHPYTRALLASLPDRAAKGALESIDGLPPRLDQGPFDACTFMPRCPLAQSACAAGEPKLYPVANGHFSRCVLHWEQSPTGLSTPAPTQGTSNGR